MKYEWIVEIDDDEGFHLEEAKWKQELVRCKDCKYSDWWGSKGKETLNCIRFLDVPPITPDFYCAWGERKEDETVHG